MMPNIQNQQQTRHLKHYLTIFHVLGQEMLHQLETNSSGGQNVLSSTQGRIA